MKDLDTESIASEVHDNGFSITRGYLSDFAISKSIELCDELTNLYGDDGLMDRLFYKREESSNRQGDAVMVSEGINQQLASLVVESPLLSNYHSLIGELTGTPVPESSRSMMNMQQYFTDSFEVCQHYDGWYSKFKHGEIDAYGERPLIIEEGLLPRYVQVVVLENENNGKGVYVQMHDSDIRIDVDLFHGDMLIFDNIAMRHGVPKLDKPRRMLGFRNFDHLPYRFTINETEDYLSLHDNVNPGYIRPISSEESVEIQIEELKEWQNGKGEEQLKKPAAF